MSDNTAVVIVMAMFFLYMAWLFRGGRTHNPRLRRCQEDKVSKIKRMDIAEFRRLGLVQEINRQMLHPLGLALGVIIDLEKCGTCGGPKESTIHMADHPDVEIRNGAHAFTETARLGGIWDFRDDPEGLRYSEQDRAESEYYEKMLSVARMQVERMEARVLALGYYEQDHNMRGMARIQAQKEFESAEKKKTRAQAWIEFDGTAEKATEDWRTIRPVLTPLPGWK